MSKATFVSKKQIIEIEEFMEIYVGKKYDGEYKLTHSEMKIYMEMKHMPRLDRISFNKLDKNDISNGTYILVRDKVGKIIPYLNPKRISCNSLLEELHSEKNMKKLRQARAKILKSMELENSILQKRKAAILANDFIKKIDKIKKSCMIVDFVINNYDLDEEYNLVKPNRQRCYVKRGSRAISYR